MEQGKVRMPAGRVRPRAAVAVGLAGLLVAMGVLSGCDSEAATPDASSPAPSVASASPSPSASSSSPSPSASPSVAIPAAARVKSDKGAEAFVRYFFDQVNVAWTTPDPERSRRTASRAASLVRQPGSQRRRAARRRRHKYAATPVTVTAHEVAGRSTDGQQYVEADLLQNRVDVVDASGRVVSSDRQEGHLQRTVAVIWRGGRWFDLRRVPSACSCGSLCALCGCRAESAAADVGAEAPLKDGSKVLLTKADLRRLWARSAWRRPPEGPKVEFATHCVLR